MDELYLVIEGRVQGVGYRFWAVRKAQEIGGISGWVRNEDNGNVEIFMRGQMDRLNQMLESCYKGPPFARVDRISKFPGVTNYFLPPIIEGKFVYI